MSHQRSFSITRRLVVTVLVLELLSAIALIGAFTVHERRVQLKAFDATLLGTAQSLLGAVGDAEDQNDNVMLDMHGLRLRRDSIYRVVDEHGRILGSSGSAPDFEKVSAEPTFRNLEVASRKYRFVALHGVRIIDPGLPNGGVRHDVDILYGAPVGHVWHEVFEAIRFFAIATLILLGVTAAVMSWMVRRGLSPIYELASEADRITSNDWHFDSPASAKTTTELAPLATALEEALARLERSFQQQRRFTSDAAHELKTDVAIVKSSLQLLSMRRRSVEEYSEGLSVSLEDFTRLEMTVEKMLALARLEQPAEHDRLDIVASCSLRDALEDVVDQNRSLAALKGIMIEAHLPVSVRVPMDQRDALLLCSNILSNAIRHSPNGGSIWIAVTTNAQMVQLSVRDQGEGIAEEDRPHLFEPFYRGDASRSRKSGGTGLGLSICNAICQRAGGSIDIANSVTGGAVVTVKIPAPPVPESASHSASLKAK
jgi:two-component system OmpR family sensor kinase